MVWTLMTPTRLARISAAAGKGATVRVALLPIASPPSRATTSS